MNTPRIIKYPFWQMAAANPKAIYACVNFGKACVPGEITELSVCINTDKVYMSQGYSSVSATDTAIRRMIKGTDRTIFKNRREFTGSLMQQMNEVYDFIDFRNQTRATIERLLRIDIRDYPEIAVREALLNLLVHRDYSFGASVLISIYTDRIA